MDPLILETPRLILRQHRISDFEECAAMWADPNVTRYIGGKPSSEQQTWARLLNYVGHWSLLGFGYWAVEDKSSGRFIGELGFADFKRQIDPSFNGMPELGWAFASHAHGKGYATEGLKAAISWGDKKFRRTRTVCIINPDNLASIRVATKCDYKEIARTTYADSPTIIFAREPISRH